AVKLSTLLYIKFNLKVEKPKTKMIITSKRDYPLTKNFPYSLEHLQASYCKLARIDTRVLCLKKLRKLDLSHNHIKQLPATIGDLVFLQELNLHDNHLETFSSLDHLRFLSAARNKLPFLPSDFRKLCLESLDLFGNPFEQPNPLVPNIQLKIP
uniref:Uncharacterized protein n=1 Tax=Anas platyrhynchos platyrhynchos TaxID=8840 RepID=A0A493T7J2_ANAPP